MDRRNIQSTLLRGNVILQNDIEKIASDFQLGKKGGFLIGSLPKSQSHTDYAEVEHNAFSVSDHEYEGDLNVPVQEEILQNLGLTEEDNENFVNFDANDAGMFEVNY